MSSFGENNGTGASIFTLRSSAFLASMVFRSLGWAYYVGGVNSAQVSGTGNRHALSCQLIFSTHYHCASLLNHIASTTDYPVEVRVNKHRYSV